MNCMFSCDYCIISTVLGLDGENPNFTSRCGKEINILLRDIAIFCFISFVKYAWFPQVECDV